MGFYRYQVSECFAQEAGADGLGVNPDLPLPAGATGQGRVFPERYRSGEHHSGRCLVGASETFLAAGLQGPSIPNALPPTRQRLPRPTSLPAQQGVDPAVAGPSVGSPEISAGGGQPDRRQIRPPRPGDSSGPGGNGIVESSCLGPSRGEASCLDRLHGAILVEVEQIIQEGRLQDVRQVDVVLMGGLGFPPSAGGILAWVDQIGLDRLVHRLADCQHASFRHHSAYPRLWQRADIHQRYYPNHPETRRCK